MTALGLAETAAAIRSRQLSSREATEVTLTALERAGTELLAVARLWPEKALAAADEADAALATGELRGPLHGVPLAHKDMFYRSGELAECGTTILRGHRPAVAATVIERLDRSGALDLGRLNMVEFALGVTG